nr:hypothetical protein [Escherichia coli]
MKCKSVSKKSPRYIQQAKDYAPSHFLLYVRYSAAGWQGDMDLPPQPLIPYADW